MNEVTGIVDNAAAMPFIYGAYGVMALLLAGLAIYMFTDFKSSEREADRLNPRKRNKK